MDGNPHYRPYRHGKIYFAHSDGGSDRLRQLSSAFPDFDLEAHLLSLPSDDGAEIYVFDGRARHLRTVDALTNALRFEFAYDAKGLLVGIKDASGNLSVIQRDSLGSATAIASPYGQTTSLALETVGLISPLSGAFDNTTGGWEAFSGTEFHSAEPGSSGWIGAAGGLGPSLTPLSYVETRTEYHPIITAKCGGFCSDGTPPSH